MKGVLCLVLGLALSGATAQSFSLGVSASTFTEGYTYGAQLAADVGAGAELRGSVEKAPLNYYLSTDLLYDLVPEPAWKLYLGGGLMMPIVQDFVMPFPILAAGGEAVMDNVGIFAEARFLWVSVVARGGVKLYF